MKIATFSSTKKFVSNLYRSTMINRGKKNIIEQQKHIYNKMPWRAPSTHHKPRIFNASDSSMAMESLDSTENSTRSLLAGKLSDGGLSGSESGDIPKGFLAVYVGPKLRRFVVPMSCLSMPEFRILMDTTAEEFGFEQDGALEFPCDEEHFQKILSRCLRQG